MLKKKTVDQEKPVVPPQDTDFEGRQLDLFRTFLCNSETERAKLSNTFDLWGVVSPNPRKFRHRKSGSASITLGL